MKKVTCVSLCGNYHAKKEWYQRCVKSWSNIYGVEEVNIIDDGSMSSESIESIESMGHRVTRNSVIDQRAIKKLKEYPRLAELRKTNKLIKKLVDTNILFESNSRILFLDSDVYVRRRIRLPDEMPDILFTSGDVSGYAGHLLAPLRYPVVLGLNSGMVLWNPEICDWDFLEEIASRGMLETENKSWWVEQFCWALLAARTASRGMFDGRDVRNISGTKKRNPQELKENKTKWFGNSATLEDRAVVEEMVAGSSVLHFPGRGKNWINEFTEPASDTASRTLRWAPVRNASYPERALLGLKLWWQG